MLIISAKPPRLIDHLMDCKTKKFVAAMLAWRSIKLRYATTVAGPIWILIQPLIQIAITTMFGKLLRINTGCDYFIFAIVSIATWSFVNASIDRMGNSLLIYRDFITRMRIPPLLYPISALSVTLVDLAITLFIANLILIAQGIHPPSIAQFVVALSGIISFTVSLGLILAVSSLFVRDLKLIIPLLAQAMLYCSPILYPASLIPDPLRKWYDLNPYCAFFELLRSSYGLPASISTDQVFVAATFSLLIFVGALWIFNRFSHRFSELV